MEEYLPSKTTGTRAKDFGCYDNAWEGVSKVLLTLLVMPSIL
jgi:hypothetical protein